VEERRYLAKLNMTAEKAAIHKVALLVDERLIEPITPIVATN